uniref:Ycf34 n=1 Tax=Pleonosporium borreri TaxID=2575635 RepID=A0A4D6WYS0_9FLOR|nr:hypothetical protein [Pleonosporium borreri]
MCICINCRHINNCKTYKFIKQKHNLTIKNSSNHYKFIPKENIIQINIKINKKVNKVILDWDLVECLSFTEKPGSWL